MVFNLKLSDSKSPQNSSQYPDDLNKAVIWMVLIHFLISSTSSLSLKILGTVHDALIAMVTFIFMSFINSQPKS